MLTDPYRQALMRQQELVEEAERMRLVRKALGNGTWREVSRRFLARTGTILIRVGERLQASRSQDRGDSHAAQRPPVGGSCTIPCHTGR